MSVTAFHFCQVLYVLFSSPNHFSNCQRENENKWRNTRILLRSCLLQSQTLTTASCLPDWDNMFWFLSMFLEITGKMSHERQIHFLKYGVQHMMRSWGPDNSITAAAKPHVCWRDWGPHDHFSRWVMTSRRTFWLMDTYGTFTAGGRLVLVCEFCHLCLSDSFRSILNQSFGLWCKSPKRRWRAVVVLNN